MTDHAKLIEEARRLVCFHREETPHAHTASMIECLITALEAETAHRKALDDALSEAADLLGDHVRSGHPTLIAARQALAARETP